MQELNTAAAPGDNMPKGARDRFREEPNPVFAERILAPIFEFNCRHNFPPLISAHRAWLIALHESGHLDKKTVSNIMGAIKSVEAEGIDAVRPFDPAIEYFYLHVERALVERVDDGEAAIGNLNLGRTRPEPLSRMVLRDCVIRLADMALDLRRELIEKAQGELETVMPGYTHLQHAQPTTLAHYLAAIQDIVARDTKRLLSALDTIDLCTLGCGAMSGTSISIDRERVRELLGFSAICENTIDSVSAGDHITETVSAVTGLMLSIGRLAQDLYVWSSQEFGMIDVSDAFSSPSSLMPQKKNALVLEYVRSRTARAVGQMTGSYTVLHNVGYMDTEEVEIEAHRPLFEALELAYESLPSMTELVRVMKADRQLMLERTAWGFSTVTALAEAIQLQCGLSYRTAHRIVARSVLLASERGKDARGIDQDLVNEAAREILGHPLELDAESIRNCHEPIEFVRSHAVAGAPAPEEVKRMLTERRKLHEQHALRLQEFKDAIAVSAKKLSEAAAELS